jgi:hypothetical protein
MAKPIKVIAINFPFDDQSVNCNKDLQTASALFDFDVVVIRPFSLGDPRTRRNIRWEEFVVAKSHVNSKNDDIQLLFKGGGVLVLILDVLQHWTCPTGGSHEVTNYDFFHDRLAELVGNGTGDRYTIVDPAEPFAKVLRSSEVRWTAYMKSLPRVPASWRIFATNIPGGIIGATLPIMQGHIILLPNFTRLNEQEFFDACREYKFRREGSPPPEWVKKAHLPGEAGAAQRVIEIEGEQKKLADARDVAANLRDALLEYKRLLFEKGRARLEPIVLRALDDLGFKSTPSEIIQGTQFEIDGRTTLGSKPGVVEVKGSKNQIGLDEISTFIPKLLANFKLKKAQSKGILVGNGLCEQPPAERLGDKVFSGHAIDAAKTSSVALVNSVELYWAACGVLSGEVSNCENLRELILGTNGYVDLKPFCGRSPFN